MKRAFVLDSGFFIENIDINIRGEIYTTRNVESEIKSLIAKARFESLKYNGLNVICIEDNEIKKFKGKLKRYKLSDTDISLIVLCLKLRDKGYEPILVTNDYSLQNVAKIFDIKFIGIGSKKISKEISIKKYCINCKIYYNYDEKFCKKCKEKLVLKIINKEWVNNNYEVGGIDKKG